MHQSFDHLPPAETPAGLYQAMRRALARDLNLPERHAAVTATLTALAAVSQQRAAALSARSRPVRRAGKRAAPAAATLDTWWCIVAHAHALTAK